MSKKFSVGMHQFIQEFNCLNCAKNFYNSLGNNKKYLKDNVKNILILNTYGWENGK